jgi:hypothetical protein
MSIEEEPLPPLMIGVHLGEEQHDRIIEVFQQLSRGETVTPAEDTHEFWGALLEAFQHARWEAEDWNREWPDGSRPVGPDFKPPVVFLHMDRIQVQLAMRALDLLRESGTVPSDIAEDALVLKDSLQQRL